MLLFDRKKAMNQILGPLEQERVEVDPAHTMAEEAMRAFEGKDAKGFADATKAMFLHFTSQGEQATGVPEE